MTHNIFIVESPLQYLNAVEALHAFNIKNSILLCRITGNRNSDEQLKGLAQKGEFNSVIYINYQNRSIIRSLLSYYSVLFIILWKFKNINTAFIGEYRSYWMIFLANNVCKGNFVVLDDGVFTLQILQDESIAILGRYVERYKSSKKYSLIIIYLVNIFNRNLLKRVTFFTMYHEVDCKHEVIVNDYFSIRSKWISEKKVNNVSYHFGSCYSERNVMSLTDELMYLKKVFEYVRKSTEKCIYLPHRKDSNEKLRLVSSIGFQVIKTHTPAELLILESDEIPVIITAFYSAVLVNLSKIFKFENIYYYQIQDSHINPKYLEAVQSTYKYMSIMGVKKIETVFCKSD